MPGSLCLRPVVLILVSTCLLGGLLSAEESPIPAKRLIAWRPGVEGGIPKVKVRTKLKSSALAKGDAATLIQAAIDMAKSPGAVLLPEGAFTLKSPLRLKSGVVLRGMGPTKTHLTFNLPETKHAGAIQITGGFGKEEIAVAGDLAAGSETISLAGTARLKKGQIILLISDNDAAVMYTNPKWNASWARNSVGQIFCVTGSGKKSIKVDTPLRLACRKDLNPRILVLEPIEQAGVEDLSLKRLDKAEDYIIGINNAVNCWVRNVISSFCMRSHIWISRSRFVSVVESYFHHAHDYGGGGHGYGVTAGTHTTDCLISNNAFRHLRHSMMVKQGANGNVFSYNYSIEHKLCDISIHGHYSYMNLFEGNVVQFVQYADYWGPTGPLTTCFRNRVTGNILVRDHSHKANVIGNVLLKGGLSIDRSCKDVFALANRIKGKLTGGDKDAVKALPPSLYLKGAPSFWGDRPWPGIGADVDEAGKAATLPAEDRYREVYAKTKVN